MDQSNPPIRLAKIEKSSGKRIAASLQPFEIHDAPPAASVPRMLYNKKDAAYQLSISVRSLEYMVAEGHIKARRIGGRVLFPHEELLRYSRHDRHHLLKPKDKPASP